MTELKVGDKVWRFDQNRRVYDGTGSFGGKVIYAEHFYQDVITGETSRSWIVGKYGYRVNKKTLEGIYTDEQKANDIWMHNNRYKIASIVDRCNDVEKMRQIAQIVGYVEVKQAKATT